MNSENYADDAKARPKPNKHISSACIACRRRKIRCDGATPRCSHCILYDKDCVYTPTEDKRKEKRKDKTAALEARIELLESLLQANGIPVPPSDVSRVEGSKPLAFEQNAAAAAGLKTDSPASSATDDAVVDQLSGRMGSLQLADDGQLRFYGPTSNLTILQNGTLSIGSSSRLSVAANWQQILDRAGVGHYVDLEIEDHLIKLYFCWEDPSIHVIDEEIFWSERARCRRERCASSSYSELLTNAICSVGASMTPRRCYDLPSNLAEFFASRSKALLDVEMDAPSLSTVQALVILSAVEALMTRDARGWLYSGMAVRLATDLGLHLDTQAYVQEGIISSDDARLRSTVFFGVFTQDQMWSLYVGRPCGLESKHITLQYPKADASDAIYRFWSPYVDEHSGLPDVQLPDSIDLLTRYNVQLVAKMQKIRETVYNNRKSKRSDLVHIGDFVFEMTNELRTWCSELASSLAVDYNDTSSLYLPHVLQLHMQYHCIMILVNRPFVTNTTRLPGKHTALGASSRNACSEAARSIAMLVRIYDRLYTLNRINVQAVHLIFTASVIHAYNACTGIPEDRDAAAADLEVCCNALRAMGQSFKNATRAHEVIIYLKVELLNRRRAKGKRTQTAIHATAQEAAAKRQHISETTTENITSTLNQPAIDTSPMNEWAYLKFDTSPQGEPFFGDDTEFDPLFWANFTTVDAGGSAGWFPNE